MTLFRCCIGILSGALFACNSHHPAGDNVSQPDDQPILEYPLNDTGITWGGNYSAGNNVTCIGEEISAQDCSHGRDVTDGDDSDGHAGFSFSKIDSNGDPLAESAASWSCLMDNTTGLMWEIKAVDGGFRDAGWTYSWYNSDPASNGGAPGTANGGVCYDSTNCDTEKFVSQFNANGLCGHADWRLPNKEELRSIVNYGRHAPAIDPDWFPNTRPFLYWTSSPTSSTSLYARCIDFTWGNDAGGSRSSAWSIRLVRSLR